MGLYDRDYMRWTNRERRTYVGESRALHPAAVLAAVAVLAAAAGVARFGFDVRVPGSAPRPGHVPVGCVGPSTTPCPPGTVRVPDPNDPGNPNEWPNDLHRSPAPTV
jgi:hypothetical protein